MTDFKGIQLTFQKNDLEQIKTLNDAATGNKTVMVMEMPAEGEDEKVVSAFEVTLPYVDEYVLYHHPNEQHIQRNEPIDDLDVEPDSFYDLPRVVQSRVHVDVPYEFATSWRSALRKAWKHVEPGDHLIVITDVPDQALSTLQEISDTATHDPDTTSARQTQLDEDITDF